ncbi:DUF1566 domain-containing protein, partial [Flavobacteriales bacterium]|nr:DUF1566 domain-containing protein [Flavobacteriales bacterium]
DVDSDEIDHIKEISKGIVTNSKGIVGYMGEPFSGILTKSFENGQLKFKKPYKDGKQDGVREVYYEDGQLKIKATYKDGKEDGIWKEYFENGQLKFKATYKDGKEDGVLEEYFENGQLKFKVPYKDGKEDGVFEVYFENGQLKLKNTFKDGKEDGVREEYFENGQLKLKATFKDGKQDGAAEEESTTSTIKIHNLEVMTFDLGEMRWYQAKIACAKVGDGWRLPTIDELDMMHVNLHFQGLGGFANNEYWSSSTNSFGIPRCQYFVNGIQSVDDELTTKAVRAVRYLGAYATESATLNQSAILKDIKQYLQNTKSTTSTIKIGNLEVMSEDLGMMKWDNAWSACDDLGDGWRLPTIYELNILYKNKDKIGGFALDGYWSSTFVDDENYMYKMQFKNGGHYFNPRDHANIVRAVRTF